jgi:putative photosynthetic complex assembly protein 2
MLLAFATVAFAVLAWWGSTGVIVAAVRSFDQRHGAVIIGSALIAALGVAALILSAGEASVTSAFVAFVGALLIWSFFEVTFLLGWITGPRRIALPVGVTGFRRFTFAAQTVIHHELALAAALIIMALALKGAANHVAVMMFALLWVMRLLAKFILFLGARHSFSELMPERLAYLQSYFRTDRTTLLFPIVLVLGLVLFGLLARAAYGASSDFLMVAHALAATFMVLALVELVVLNLPLRDSALWAWAMPKIAPQKTINPV